MTTRIATLDAVRGVAVMGILLLNIVDFAMPGYAYVDPNYYGGASGANWWAWALAFVLADGKMRGLFTMLFGASTVLIARRAEAAGENPALVHYARMAVLFAIGMVHAYLIWSGDILVLYAVCGALVYPAWRWRKRALVFAGVALLLFQLITGMLDHAAARDLQRRGEVPAASVVDRAAWTSYRDQASPPPATAAADLAGYRGGYTHALVYRAPITWRFQTEMLQAALPDTLALMLLGMALFRNGFFSGTWRRRSYVAVAAGGFAVCVPLYIPLVRMLDTTHFSPPSLLLTDAVHLMLLRPWLSLGWASLVILFLRSGALLGLASRLTAAGRMAFSNYLGTSFLCTLLFNGYGLAWYGHLQRWQCYLIVLAIWVLILAWSQPWLARFRYGPCEWLWRSAARGRLQPMRLPNATR